MKLEVSDNKVKKKLTFSSEIFLNHYKAQEY